MFVYKIRNKRNPEEFSTGGACPKFTSKKSKIWQEVWHVRAHLAMFGTHYNASYLNDAEIVEFELIERGIIPYEGKNSRQF